MQTATARPTPSTPYTQLIRETLAAVGVVGRYDPHDVEAWMRVEHGTLDALIPAAFRAEVAAACACIDASPRDETAALRASFGL